MKSLLSKEEESELVKAIEQVESRTSAEIRICITDRRVWRPERYAWKVFDRAGMRHTHHRNAALIMVLSRMKKIVVIGDHGLNELVADGYWEETVEAMVQSMKSEGALSSLLTGLYRLGELLATHWPPDPDNPNELPDEIMH